MAKVKFPLEMAEGVYVRTIEELKQNFDANKVISYFLDGKLQTWLEDRYYDIEAKQVAELISDDVELAKKICNIFSMDYNEREIISTEEIIIKNKRLNKLKQITDDEKILKNIDLVAFDQDDLNKLLEQKADRIWLCNGKFEIPKSDYKPKYFVIGNSNVTGLEVDEEIYSVVLVETGNEKLKLMNVLSTIPILGGITLGLSDIKFIVDHVPQTIKSNLTQYESQEIASKLESVGAKVVCTDKKYSSRTEFLKDFSCEKKVKTETVISDVIKKVDDNLKGYNEKMKQIFNGLSEKK